jgi:hypothetical protein
MIGVRRQADCQRGVHFPRPAAQFNLVGAGAGDVDVPGAIAPEPRPHLRALVQERILPIGRRELGGVFGPVADGDADLLGGVKVTMNNIVLDGSVKKRLEDMREKLMSVRID